MVAGGSGCTNPSLLRVEDASIGPVSFPPKTYGEGVNDVPDSVRLTAYSHGSG